MENAKLDSSLSLALEVPQSLREEMEDLNAGFNPADNTWELIVRFHGDLAGVVRELNAAAVILSGGYAILTIAQDAISRLSEFEEIEYIEKPKRIEFAVIEGISASCILPFQRGENGLFGKDVICAVIDSGIDYEHPDFRNADGTTRILALWDQTVKGTPPAGYIRGTLFTREEINNILLGEETETMEQNTEENGDFLKEENRLEPSRDISGHGTHVAGICAGNGRASGGRNRGVAPKSDLLIVKLGESVGESFPRTTNLMEAIQFVVDFSIAVSKPVAVNISFGNSYGSHSGRSLLETYVDYMAAVWKSVFCIGTGNEGGTGHHKGGTLVNGEEQIVELAVANYENGLNLQIWKNYFDVFDIEMISPGGKSAGLLSAELGSNEFTLENTRILFYYGAPRPYNGLQEIYIDFIPQGQYISSGIWKFRFVPRKILEGRFDMWIPAGSRLNPQTRFLRPTEETTLTIPSTAARAVSVGAYDSTTDSYAYFSGRGYTWENQWIKPEIVAPGVNIVSCSPGGGYVSRTGTSMATPFVTGSAALMMEWGIVNGNDAYLYGQKVKAYLIKGARQLPGFERFPNPQVGYGALCLSQSLPL